MYRYVLLVLLALLFPAAVSAQTPTPTPTLTDDGIISTYNYDLTPEPQFSADMSHDDILRFLGVQESYQIGVMGTADLTRPGVSQLSEVLPLVAPRSAAAVFISCSDRNGSMPSTFQELDGSLATVTNWDWPTYRVCGNLSGPACAAALGDKTTYTYYYNDMGRGSYFTVPYLSFVGAPLGTIAPPSALYSTTPEWSVKLFYERGSTRKPEAGVIPTWSPDTPNPSAFWDFVTNIWNPKEIGKIFDSSVSGRRWYLANIASDQVANYAVQIRLPKIYLNTFKPRISVCAMRPSQYSPEYAATAVIEQTKVSAERTKTAGDVSIPPGATPQTLFEYYDKSINDMWYGGGVYLKCKPLTGKTTYEHCYIDFYGAAGSVPTVLRSGLGVRLVEYDPSDTKLWLNGRTIATTNFTAPRGSWARLTFESVRNWARNKGITFDPYRMVIAVSCPLDGVNILCSPSVNGNAYTHMYNNSADNRKPMRASNSVLGLYGSYPMGVQHYLTATAYKTQKTPTRTMLVMTAVPTITRQPTVLVPTMPPLPPTINATTQAAATRTAITNQQRTATAAAGVTYATQTKLAQIYATATAQQSQLYLMATQSRQTATAQIAIALTSEAVATQYLAATLTSIADTVSTVQATQQSQIDRTATVAVLIDNGDAVIRYSTNQQLEQVNDVSKVGPGAVFELLGNAVTAFDRGLYNSPCNGFPASIGGSSTSSGAYQITNDLADSLCQIRIWLDAQTSVVPLVKQILSAIFVLLIVIMVMRIMRGSNK